MATRNWVVGNAADCDIRVDNRTVSGKHCRLTERGETFLLEDLQSTNGTFVAGERITGPRIVRRGDPVTLGRHTPLPWPEAIVAITIGRRADNDVVIPLDAVSGEHARLEREGSRVFLVDLGSTNGTALNDPANKIKRAVLKPTDAVFLGTHRVSAADLLAALPTTPPDATMLERERPPGLDQGPPPPSATLPVPPQPSLPLAGNTTTSWLVGAVLSVLCIAALVAGARAFRRSESSIAALAAPESAADKPAAPDAPPPVDHGRPEVPNPKRRPDEALVRKSADAVFVMALRTEQKLAIADVTAWACGPRTVICPTALLEDLESLRKESDIPNRSVVVCAPNATLAIIDCQAGVGSAAGFSRATIEASLTDVCTVAPRDYPDCAPGHQLAMLSTRSPEHDAKTVVRELFYLTIDRVDRDPSSHVPTKYKCRTDADIQEVAGSPVFDTSGRVVGCALLAATATHEIHVVPIARLAALLETTN